MDLAWVLYSVLSQMAVGMGLVMALAGNVPGFAAMGPMAEGPSATRAGWLVAAVLMVVALGSASYRLGALADNWGLFVEQGLRWLSAPVQVYALFLLLALWQVRREQPRLAVATALVGLFGLVLAARDYHPEAFPDTSWLTVCAIYLLTALSLGLACSWRLTGEEARPFMRCALMTVLVFGCLLHTVAPVLGGSGWLETLSVVGAARPLLVWIGLGCAFVVPLAALLWVRRLPDRVPWIMLFGSITLRMLFA